MFKEILVDFSGHLLFLLIKEGKKNVIGFIVNCCAWRGVQVFSLRIAFQVKVGCCTVDILKQVSGEEISRTAPDAKPIDRLSRLANHILSQQR